jgi:hypothetical protein
MTTLNAARVAQYPLVAEFTFDIAAADAMKNISGVLTEFKAAAGVFDAINLPGNATVIGGELVVEVVSNDTGTATLAVGDSALATRYLAATNLKALARTALVPTGFRGAGENIRLTLANANGNATTGKATVRVMYTIQGRGNEVQPG